MQLTRTELMVLLRKLAGELLNLQAGSSELRECPCKPAEHSKGTGEGRREAGLGLYRDLSEGRDHSVIDSERIEMPATASDLLVFLGAAFLTVQ
jgi:hypothetical protein